MAEITIVIRAATLFSPSGEIDEDAMRQHFQRYVDERIGLLIASGASGEGFALSNEELGLIYRIGVEVSNGKVLVGSNQPETHTPRAAIELAQIAAKAGVDVVNLYAPASWHGYIPNDEEYLAYFDQVFREVKHPVTLSPNATLGWAPSPTLVSSLVDKYPQVVSVNLSGTPGDGYFLALQRTMNRKVDIYVAVEGSLNTLALGAKGLLGGSADLIPRTSRHYADLYVAGQFGEIHAVYDQIRRVTSYIDGIKGKGNARFVKMFIRGFKLPGWTGGMRSPYIMASDAEVQRFVEGILALDVPEINDYARAAGVI